MCPECSPSSEASLSGLWLTSSKSLSVVALFACSYNGEYLFYSMVNTLLDLSRTSQEDIALVQISSRERKLS